jgi:hypothetical protein
MNGKFSVLLKRGESKESELMFDPSDIIELNIVEDIFNYCMSGSLIFYDKLGWTEQLEIVGFDPIIVIYKESDVEVKKMFIVYHYEAIVEELQQSTGVKKAKWYLVEPIFNTLINKKYSKAWGENKKGSDIVKDICKNILEVDDKSYKNFEETKEKFDNFYIPYWTVSEAINWISCRCSGSKSDLPGYLFYSNSQGINFVTIDSLFTSSTREKNEDGTTIKYKMAGLNDDTNKILNWYVNPPDITSLKYLCGSTKIGYDFENKEIINQSHTYKDMINKYHIFGKTTLFRDISDTNTNINIVCEDTPDILNNLILHDFILRYIRQLSVGIVVRGESTRYAGMIIDVEWKSTNEQNITDKMMEGLYLVKSITHQFTTGTNVTPPYRQLLTCIKAGYGKTEGGQLMEQVKDKTITDKYVDEKK